MVIVAYHNLLLGKKLSPNLVTWNDHPLGCSWSLWIGNSDRPQGGWLESAASCLGPQLEVTWTSGAMNSWSWRVHFPEGWSSSSVGVTGRMDLDGTVGQSTSTCPPQHGGLREVWLLPRWVRVLVNKEELMSFWPSFGSVTSTGLCVKAVIRTCWFKRKGHNSTFEECQRIWSQVLISSQLTFTECFLCPRLCPKCFIGNTSPFITMAWNMCYVNM